MPYLVLYFLPNLQGCNLASQKKIISPNWLLKVIRFFLSGKCEIYICDDII